MKEEGADSAPIMVNRVKNNVFGKLAFYGDYVKWLVKYIFLSLGEHFFVVFVYAMFNKW